MYSKLIYDNVQQATTDVHTHKVIYDHDKGEKLCQTCGIVIYDKISDAEIENNFYTQKSFLNNPNSHKYITNDGDMSTVISDTTLGIKKADQHMQNKIRFLSKVVSCSNRKRNLKIAIDLLQKLKDKLSLTPFCVEEASQYYKKTIEMGLIKGRSIKEMIAACVYLVCKKIHIPRTLPEISETINANFVFASRCYRLLIKKLKISYVQSSPIYFIRRIAEDAQIKEKVIRDALDILITLQNDNVLMSKTPTSIAGAVLYIACINNKFKITQGKIAEAAKINIMTLRKRISEIQLTIANISFAN